jgi:2-oxo-3-hexenedioate decarboxylase
MTTPYAAGFVAQLDAMRGRIAAGMPRRGWKVGINVPEIQAKLSVEHSLVGWLDGDKILRSGAKLPIPPGSLLHVEPELCLRLEDAVDAGADQAAARAAVDAVAPALEIVDYAKPAKTLTDIVQHSMFHAACVLGDWRPVPPQGCIDIAHEVRLRVGSRESEPARADLVPADVGEIVLLVASVLHELGERLLPGDLILSGSFTARALPLSASQTAVATLGDLGVVRCTACA